MSTASRIESDLEQSVLSPKARFWLLTKKPFFLTLSGIVFLAVFLGLSGSVPYVPRAVLSITLAAIVLWVFEPIPFSMTAVIVLFALPVSGAASTDLVLSGFSSPAVFLIVAGMMIASAVQQTDLGKRLTYLLLYWFGEIKGGVLAGILLIPQIMAIFIPATAVRTAILLPIVYSVAEILGIKIGDVRSKQLMMAVAVGCTISGTAILPAAVGNVVTVDLANYYLKQHITYLDWLLLALPLWLLLIPVAWWILYRCFPVKEEAQKNLKEKVRGQIAELGPLTGKEKRLLLILTGVFVLWILEGVHGWPPVIPAFIGVVLIAWPGVRVAKWDSLLNINFSTLLLLGVTLSLGRVLSTSGAIGYLSKWLEHDWTRFLFSNPYLAVLMVIVLTQLIHKVTSNVSTSVIATVPVVIALASQGAHVSILLLVFVSGLTSLFGFLLVVETIPSVMVHGTGWVTQKDFLRCGIWLTLTTTALTFLMALTWWKWLGYMQ
ncbi:SLC13 family permease [Effusibacillus dendaii]|uniref:Sodium-dependent dicarboxylate transporter SdcS n=1 Tax=Effusibacillus dendaii TaxID=2743772 RepID=A0A7I8D7W5_9BACL|nr:DASS family sodium-coupled anion symporter [Effusibacillus dendaii]BCJ86204.1 membrane protein [Effusibacillus dendaii]